MARIPLNVRVSPDLLIQVKRRAAAENRTVSNLVDTALRRYTEGALSPPSPKKEVYADQRLSAGVS